jgi:NAD-dependent dihydropyrimidine dehydrogenase PreA subunit
MKSFYQLLERARAISPATRSFLEQSHSLIGAAHGWIYARFTQRYINFLLQPRKGADGGASRWLAGRYHGKVLTEEQARAIVVNERVIRQDLEQVVPYPTAREIVLNGPPEIAVYECVCRHARPSPCQPTQVCMVVGQPMVDMILEYHPDQSRRLGQEEALELLRAEHERGHVHAAWFKDAMLGRFYAICNCCKCCCGGIEGMRNSGAPWLASSGYVAGIDRDACCLCGACAEGCPFDALAMGDEAVALKWERCMGCGACEALCPSGAVRLVRDERKGIPLDVRAL